MPDLENILGFVIFIIIAISSIVSKMREQRKAEVERQARKRKRPEDLPEATRRMLYGEPGEPPALGQAPGHDIPTARRKQPAGAAPMPSRSFPEAVPMPQRQAARQQAVPVEGQPLPASPAGSDEERRVRELRRRLQQQLEAQRKEAEFARQKAERIRMEKAARQRAQQQQPAARRATRPIAPAYVDEQEGPSAPAPQAQQRAPHVPVSQGAPRKTAPVGYREMLKEPRTLREAIILSEILQPPVSLR